MFWHNAQPLLNPAAQFPPALLRGDGLMETLRIEQGTPLGLSAHLIRLVQSAPRSGYQWPRLAQQLSQALEAPLAHPPSAHAEVLRVFVFPSEDPAVPSILVQRTPWEPPPVETWIDGATLHLSPIRHPGNGELGKSMSRHWAESAQRLARAAGFHEALLLNAEGKVVETTHATVIWQSGEHWATAPAHLGGLPGVTLKTLESLGLRVERETIGVDELVRRQGVALLSSLRLVVGVSRIGDYPVPHDDRPLNALRQKLLEAAR